MAGNFANILSSEFCILNSSFPTGYREIRYPKMDEAKRKAESLLNSPSPSVAKSVAHVSI